MAEPKTPVAPKATTETPKPTTEVVTNFQVVDNTAAPAVVAPPAKAEEVELLDGFVQVNYL